MGIGPDPTSMLAQLRDKAFQARGGQTVRTGRGTAEKSHLLDDEDQNIGNGIVVYPQVVPTVNPETNPARLLALDAISPSGQLVTVVLTAQGTTVAVPPFNAAPFGSTFGGPIIGIVEFGNGSVFTRIEVDVPIGPIYLAGAVPPPRESMDGGVSVTVPAGTLRVYARHDGNLIPSNLEGDPMGSIHSVPNLNNTQYRAESFSPTPVLVKAFVNYFTRPTTVPPTRTVYALQSSAGTSLNLLSGPSLVDSQPIPPFATTARIIRGDVLAPVAISIYWFSPANNDIIEAVTIPAGTQSPRLPVPRQATWYVLVTIEQVQFAAVEFEIGF